MTETLLAVAQEIADGLYDLPWWAVVALLVFLFAGATGAGLRD